MHAFFVQNFDAKAGTYLEKGFSYKKGTHKILMKLTPGLNFINVLCTAFTLEEPKSIKKTDNSSVFFMLLGSTSLKAKCKYVAEIDSRAQFHQHSMYSFYAHRSRKHKKIFVT